MLKLKYGLAAICLITTTSVFADTSVSMFFTTTKGTGESVGTIKISETPYGLLFTPDLHGLTQGIHGFHIHQNPSCDDNGMAAGGHLDPHKTNKHRGPYSKDGHLGDLPALYVDKEGKVTLPVVAPRLHHLSEIKDHSLMIHDGGDNYSDTPAKLGGGGDRMVCGVVK